MAKVEFQIAPDSLHLFQREVNFLNRVWWTDAIVDEYGERVDDFISATLHINFPQVGEYRIVGWVQHKENLAVFPLHLEQAQEMDEHIQSRKCDLLGRKQSRRETWILVDRDGVLLCCGPAGAGQLHTSRYRLDAMTVWLRLLHRVVSKCGGVL